jgi:hypothetical protein
MAFSPRGVAALSNPNILAEKFINIEPNIGLSFGKDGNSLEKNGDTQRANIAMIPPRSPIFIIPNQRDNTPVSPRDISNAVRADENDEFIISLHTFKSPPKVLLIIATTKAIKKKAIQI